MFISCWTKTSNWNYQRFSWLIWWLNPPNFFLRLFIKDMWVLLIDQHWTSELLGCSWVSGCIYLSVYLSIYLSIYGWISIKSTCKLFLCISKNLRWLNKQVERVLRRHKNRFPLKNYQNPQLTRIQRLSVKQCRLESVPNLSSRRLTYVVKLLGGSKSLNYFEPSRGIRQSDMPKNGQNYLLKPLFKGLWFDQFANRYDKIKQIFEKKRKNGSHMIEVVF